MKALLKSRQAVVGWWLGFTLVACLAVAGRAQTVEVDEMRKHAESGLAEAQNTLGLIYKSGTGVTQDFTQALKWFQQSAEQGYAAAQNNLAIAYALGQGVPKDPVEAYKWFALGATHGDNQRSDLREAITKELTPAQVAEAEKRVKEFVPGK